MLLVELRQRLAGEQAMQMHRGHLATLVVKSAEVVDGMSGRRLSDARSTTLGAGRTALLVHVSIDRVVVRARNRNGLFDNPSMRLHVDSTCAPADRTVVNRFILLTLLAIAAYGRLDGRSGYGRGVGAGGRAEGTGEG